MSTRRPSSSVLPPVIARRVFVALALFGILALEASAVAGVILKQPIPATGIDRLVLRNRVGRIRITPTTTTTAPAVKVRVRCRNGSSGFSLFGLFRWGARSCTQVPHGLKVVAIRQGSSLHLGLVNADGVTPRHVRADWTLVLPPRFEARIHDGVGNVQITGLRGGIVLHVGVGAVTLKRDRTRLLKVHDGVGTIDVDHFELPAVAGLVHLHSGVGNVVLRLAPVSFLPHGRIDVQTGVGHIAVQGLPCRLARLRARAGVGHVKTSVLPAGFHLPFAYGPGHAPPTGFHLQGGMVGETLSGGGGPGLDVRLASGTGSISIGFNCTKREAPATIAPHASRH